MEEPGAGLSAFRRYTWWAVPGTVVGVLVVAYGTWVLDGDVPLWARVPVVPALCVAAVAAGVLLSRWMTAPFDDSPPALQPPAWWLVTAAAVLAALPLARHDYGLWAVAPAVTVAIVAAFLPAAGKRWLIAGAVVLALVPGGVVSLVADDGESAYAALFPAGLTAFTVWTVLGPLWAWRIAGRLDRARRVEAELAARLAVQDERLRFASELHDIQGHHLQVIAMKSDLASRATERDPAGAAAEMQEIRQLCTEALRDTRAVVRGYRRTTLDDEITGATRVLASAGVEARNDIAATGLRLPCSADHLLGLAVREATTNVLRHSRARYVEIEYTVVDGHARLRIGNDGAGAPPLAAAGDGTGLAGLGERLRAAGGELAREWEGERFVLTVTLPVEDAAGS